MQPTSLYNLSQRKFLPWYHGTPLATVYSLSVEPRALALCVRRASLSGMNVEEGGAAHNYDRRVVIWPVRSQAQRSRRPKHPKVQCGCAWGAQRLRMHALLFFAGVHRQEENSS